MKKGTKGSFRLTAVLTLLVLLLNLTAIPGRAATETGLEGKKLSVLGDSISTYEGVSNGIAHNITLYKNAVFYTEGKLDIHREDTWWQQTCDRLGMELLVNNSWSGSCMYMPNAGTKGAYRDRCVQLHNWQNEEPDIIAIFLGTNDEIWYPYLVGTVDEIDFDKLIVPKGKGYSYPEPATCMEAYAIALHKIGQRYPDAEVYCMTLLNRNSNTPGGVEFYNRELTNLAKHFGVHLVDLSRCGITTWNSSWYMGDALHPGPQGMDAITSALVSEILRSSRYVREDVTLENVSYNLNNALILQGTPRTVVHGEPFRAEVVSLSGEEADVRVLMGAQDITDRCYQDGVIQIDSVEKNLYIRANGR